MINRLAATFHRTAGRMGVLGLLLGIFFLARMEDLSAGDFSFAAVEQMAQSGQNPGAFGVLSLYHRYGFGTPQNLFVAASVIPEEAAGHPFCQYNMGVLLMNRAGAEEDENTATIMRQKADQLFQQAIHGLQVLAEASDPVGQLLLGGAYETGRGVPHDPSRAFDLYFSSANAGFPLAWSNLADLLIKGNGCNKDISAGIRLMQKAANSGVPMAKYTLAQAYLKGEGVSKSVEQGIRLLKDAADTHNHNLAMTDLAIFYLDGVHVRKNESLGMEYLRRAVEANSAAAVKRARRMNYRVDVSTEFPQSFFLALAGEVQTQNLRPIFHSSTTPSATLPTQTLSTSTLPTEIPAISQSTPKPPPGLEEFQKKFASKAESSFQSMQDALIGAIQGGDFSATAIWQKLSPSTGKASDWLEDVFAPENLLRSENPAWSPFLLRDKSFAYSAVDLPTKILPLIQKHQNTEALQVLRSVDTSGISPEMTQAWQNGFTKLDALVSEKILSSEKVREQVKQAIAANQAEAALDLLRQAMTEDLRVGDDAQVRQLEQKIKEKAFQDTGL